MGSIPRVDRVFRVRSVVTIAPAPATAPRLRRNQAMAFMTGQVRSRLSTVGVGLVLAAAVAACGSSATPSPSAASSGAATTPDGNWVLVSYTSPGGTQTTVPSALLPTLQIQGNAARGNAGCNTYNAIAVVSGNMIHYDQVQSTKVACPPPGSVVEAAFLQGLSLASEWKIEGDTLTMTAPRGQPPILVFKPAA
jgi:heat shock protein HslJ